MRRLSTADPAFAADFAALLAQARETTEIVGTEVAAIIAAVRARGNCAV
jgi:histidinol dehydrogenase